MLKKQIAIALLATGLTAASFAQVGAGAPTTIPHDTPKAAAEQTTATPAAKPAKHHIRKHRKHHHKAAKSKVETAAPAN